MQINKQLEEFVNLNCENNGIPVEYDIYLESSVEYPSFYNEKRDIDDLVTLTAWSTTREGIMSLVFTTLTGTLNHAIKIAISPKTESKPHKHNYIELAYLVSGRQIQKINNKSVTFSKNEICIIDQETLHTDILLNEDATVLYLAIPTSLFNHLMHISKSSSENARYLKQLISTKTTQYDFLRFVPKEDASQTKQTFELLLNELLANRPSKSKIVQVYIERLTQLLPLEYRIVLNKSDQNEVGNALFSDIEEFIKANYNEVTVKMIADLYHYNSDYLSRLFIKKTSLNLSKYIQKIRMEKAIELLESTNLSINQIASQVGYHNIGFFYKKFKEHFHTTPNKLR